MSAIRKPSKFPEYNPEKDGNKFEWILRQASILHEKQGNEIEHRVRFDYLTGEPITD